MPIETGNRALCDTTFTLTAEQIADPASRVKVSLCCRLVNGTSAPLVGAVLRFVLPPDIIVAPNEPAATVIEPIEPSAEWTIVRAVTVHPSTDDAALSFLAILALTDGRLLRTNVVVTRIVRCSRLNGPGTLVYVDSTPVAGEFLVVAQIVNDGNASAQHVELDLPLPAGTEAVDPAASTWTCDELAPGESRSFARHVRVVDGTLQRLQAAGVRVRDAAGTNIAFAPSAPLVVPALLPAPVFCVTRVGRRVHVTVRGTNAGAGSASGVKIALGWPATFRCSAASLTWNAARVTTIDNSHGFARALVRDSGADLSIAAIDAGASYELTFALDPTSRAQAGLLTAAMSTDATTVSAQCTLDWSPDTEIRLRRITPLAAADAGDTARFTIDVWNAGDNDTTVRFEVDGTVAAFCLDDELGPASDPEQLEAAIAVAAGERRLVTFSIHVPDGLGYGHVFSVALDAYVADERVATRQIALSVPNNQCDNGRVPVAPHPARLELATASAEFEKTDGQAVTFFLPLDSERIDLCLRALRAQRASDMFAHLCGLRPFFVTNVRSSDAAIADLLQTAVGAVQDLLDRLALKRRLPNVSLSGRDCEDGRVRSSLLELFAAIAVSRPAPLPCPDRNPALQATIESRWAQRQLAQIGGNPLGDLAALQAIVALLPSSDTGSATVGVALSSYAAALRTALALTVESPWADCAGLLDAARSRLIAALVTSRNEGSDLMYAG